MTDITTVTVTLTVPSDRLADLQKFCEGETYPAVPKPAPPARAATTSIDEIDAHEASAPPEPEKPAPKKRGRPKGSKNKAKAEAAPTPPAETAAPEPAAPEPAVELSRDEVLAAIQKAVEAGATSADVQAALQGVEATCVSDIPEERRAEFVAALPGDE